MKRKLWKRCAFLVLLLFIVVGCSSGYENGENQVATPETPSVVQNVEQEPEQPPQSEEETDTDSKYIPGLMSGDIKTHMKTWGIKFTGPQVGEDLVADYGVTIDPDTRVKLHCDIYEASPMQIEWVEFIVDGSLVAWSMDNADFDEITKAYLGYAATLPYDGANPAKAKAWIEANVKAAKKQGNVLSTVIGPVKFDLYGTEWMRVLEVKPKDAE